MSPRLVLLASYPKSGNTWLRLVLANLLRDGHDAVPLNAIGLGRYGQRRQLFDHYAPWPAEDLHDTELDRWWPDVYRQLDAAGDGPEFIKTHSGAWRDADGEWLFPAGSVRAVLHVTRHPFDVAVSFANHLGRSVAEAVEIMTSPGWVARPPRRAAAAALPERWGSWAEHTASWLAADLPYPVITARYEDLLADPQRGFAALAAAAGITTPGEAVTRAVERTRFERLQAEEATTGFPERPASCPRFFRAGRAGTWSGLLSGPERVALRTRCADLMATLSYPDRPPAPAGATTEEGEAPWANAR
jgi:aryl sulfotransferase